MTADLKTVREWLDNDQLRVTSYVPGVTSKEAKDRLATALHAIVYDREKVRAALIAALQTSCDVGDYISVDDRRGDRIALNWDGMTHCAAYLDTTVLVDRLIEGLSK